MTQPLAVDWDGTVTERDSLHMVIERFGDVDVFHAQEAVLGRRLALDEVIAIEMATITAPLAEVVGWLLESVRLRPGFRELVARHDPLVVSAGFHELIDPILAREGITVRVIANRLDPQPTGWVALFRPGPACPVCGERCKRLDLAHPEETVYVGDGFSDRCVARAAARVFARDGLARYLEAAGVDYEPFDDFVEVADALARGGPGSAVKRRAPPKGCPPAGDSRGG